MATRPIASEARSGRARCQFAEHPFGAETIVDALPQARGECGKDEEDGDHGERRAGGERLPKAEGTDRFAEEPHVQEEERKRRTTERDEHVRVAKRAGAREHEHDEDGEEGDADEQEDERGRGGKEGHADAEAAVEDRAAGGQPESPNRGADASERERDRGEDADLAFFAGEQEASGGEAEEVEARPRDDRKLAFGQRDP